MSPDADPRDHAGCMLDAAHMHGDTARTWVPGSPLPPGEFLEPGQPRRAFALPALLGSTALFYYLLHVHLIALTTLVLKLDPHAQGLAKTWIGAGLTIAVLVWPCAWYRRYKAAHPDGWTRYI